MTTATIEHSLAKRLKAMTHDAHESVDRSIMAASSFASIGKYRVFLKIQYLFHRDIAALYADPRLQDMLPGLAERCRMPLVLADMHDLGVAAPDSGAPLFAGDEPVDVATGLGWLYVAEGSNMGAALLRKEAQKLGLSDDHGARHLAPAPEGPAAHWRAFVAGLDSAPLTPEEEDRAVAGAQAAFARAQAHVDAHLG